MTESQWIRVMWLEIYEIKIWLKKFACKYVRLKDKFIAIAEFRPIQMKDKRIHSSICWLSLCWPNGWMASGIEWVWRSMAASCFINCLPIVCRICSQMFELCFGHLRAIKAFWKSVLSTLNEAKIDFHEDVVIFASDVIYSVNNGRKQCTKFPSHNFTLLLVPSFGRFTRCLIPI